MTVTDEMVEAHTEVLAPIVYPEGLEDWKLQVCRRMSRAALTAALKVAPVGQTKVTKEQVNELLGIVSSTPYHALPERISECLITVPAKVSAQTMEWAKSECDRLRAEGHPELAPAGVVDRERVARTIAYAGRNHSDRNEDADHFWAYTGEARRAKAYRQADAILSTLTTREEVEREVIERLAERAAADGLCYFRPLHDPKGDVYEAYDGPNSIADWLRSQGSAS